MPSLSRSQIIVYGAIAVALLLIGARWVRAADRDGEQAGGDLSAAASADPAGNGTLHFDRDDGDLVVHVAGAVREAGVYRFPDGSRVADAIERAGGASADAVPDAINLAAPLADGQQVVVPGRAPAAGGAATAAGAGAAATAIAPDLPISLGTATVEQLDTIEGIGPVTAAEIIEYRDQHGGVGSIDDLDEISGIGPATMESLRERLQP